MRTTLRQRQAAQTRETLLDAAARVFARRGYSEATIDDVAEEAGASKGAVYHHFATKQKLFRALLAHRVAGLDPLRELAEGALSLEALIDGLVGLWFDRVRDRPEAVVLSLESRLQALREPAAANLLNSYYGQLRATHDELLRKAARRFHLAQPSPHTALIVFSLLDGACQQAALDPRLLDDENFKGALAHAVASALRPEPMPG
ncbi:transcriptional regulator, TetR family [Amycolatopsis marina]|uniref:Transcriptional regulator, TetR family n=2 Tax=Amycolatopsis marina TaxID=490629 RepID=A0A1I1C2I6_9PSEU|nr:transcriptional regulator, TetR family [Amycolatopsis marina]